MYLALRIASMPLATVCNLVFFRSYRPCMRMSTSSLLS